VSRVTHYAVLRLPDGQWHGIVQDGAVRHDLYLLSRNALLRDIRVQWPHAKLVPASWHQPPAQRLATDAGRRDATLATAGTGFHDFDPTGAFIKRVASGDLTEAHAADYVAAYEAAFSAELEAQREAERRRHERQLALMDAVLRGEVAL
jgi:hypothetical protein